MTVETKNRKRTTSPVIVTLLDGDYLPKLVVLYHSLRQHWPAAQLLVYCFDDLTFEILTALRFPQLTPVAFADFATPHHQQQLTQMSFRYESYWSYKPHLLLDAQARYPRAKNLLYLDCDIMFFSDPQDLLIPSDSHDILLQPNNFSAKEMDQFVPVGYYCAGFISFRPSPIALSALEWWQSRCLEWCFSRFEEGKFGDQKYLDDWRTRFPKVEEVVAIGAGVAPWNVQKYDVSTKNKIPQVNHQPVIYYHYHSFAMNYVTLECQITGDRNNTYSLSKNVLTHLYNPYIAALRQAVKELTVLPPYLEYLKDHPQGQTKALYPQAEYTSFRNSSRA